MDDSENLVIGSGPTGSVVAKRLTELGKTVSIIDSGSHGLCVKSNFMVNEKNKFNYKKNFGSDYVYKQNKFSNMDYDEKIVGRISYAEYGFSKIWGGAFLPYSNLDLKNFRRIGKELEIEYKNLSEYIPVSSDPGSFKDSYVVPSKPNLPIMVDAGLSPFLKSQTFKYKNYSFESGITRLALHMEGTNACTYSGNCIVGCKFKSIWSSEEIISKLLLKQNFLYKNETYIHSIEEKKDFVEVNYIDLKNQKYEIKTNRAEKVFLAAGGLGTPAILTRSKYTNKIEIKTSRLIILPLISKFARFGFSGESNFGLSQISISVSCLSTEKTKAHIQLYPGSPQLFDRILEESSLSNIFPSKLKNKSFKHIAVAFVYLELSEGDYLSMERISNDSVKIKQKQSSNSSSLSLKTAITKYFSYHEIIPLWKIAKFVDGGGAFHFGSSFPVTETKNELKNSSDLVGRPFGLHRIHIVDSSVLPTIVPGPITATAMSNAVRIINEIQ